MHPLDSILRPRSIAVVGASRQVGSIGHEIVSNLLQYGFTGPVYPVNPRAGAVAVDARIVLAPPPSPPPVPEKEVAVEAHG